MTTTEPAAASCCMVAAILVVSFLAGAVRCSVRVEAIECEMRKWEMREPPKSGRSDILKVVLCLSSRRLLLVYRVVRYKGSGWISWLVSPCDRCFVCLHVEIARASDEYDSKISDGWICV